jgi:hypothetical protein
MIFPCALLSSLSVVIQLTFSPCIHIRTSPLPHIVTVDTNQNPPTSSWVHPLDIAGASYAPPAGPPPGGEKSGGYESSEKVNQEYRPNGGSDGGNHYGGQQVSPSGSFRHVRWVKTDWSREGMTRSMRWIAIDLLHTLSCIDGEEEQGLSTGPIC